MSRVKESLVIGSVQDRLGRIVVLEPERWKHICKHEQLNSHELAVMRAVETAEKTKPGNFSGSEVLFGQNLGPARWLAVVVEYDGFHGRVITAYPHNKEPRLAA